MQGAGFLARCLLRLCVSERGVFADLGVPFTSCINIHGGVGSDELTVLLYLEGRGDGQTGAFLVSCITVASFSSNSVLLETYDVIGLSRGRRYRT